MMRTSKTTLGIAMAVAALATSANAQVQFSPSSTTYTQDFNTLPTASVTGGAPINGQIITALPSTTLANWYSSRAGTNTNENLIAGTGSSGTGGLYSFGGAASSDRALGAVSSGSNAGITYGVRIRNNGGPGEILTTVNVAGVMEQWRTGGNTITNPAPPPATIPNPRSEKTRFFYTTSTSQITTIGTPVATQNSNDDTNPTVGTPDPFGPPTGAGTYTAFTALDLTSLIDTLPAGALDGNDNGDPNAIPPVPAKRSAIGATITFPITPGSGNPTAGLFPGEEAMLIWSDPNNVGNDHGIAIDDVTLIATFEDTDGVNAAIEDGAPNLGDGNLDSVLDRVQSTVASLPNALNAEYITIVSPAGTNITNVAATLPPGFNPIPAAGVTMPVGLISYRVNGLTPGATINVTIRYANAATVAGVNNYYKYNANTNTWTEFSGVGVATFDGVQTFTLTLTDGGQGDLDGVVNGSILDPGGPGIGGPVLAADITSLTATAAFAGAPVAINWTTASELDNAGFTVKNAATGAVVGSFVPAEGSASTGASYSVIDPAGLATGETRSYILEDVDLSGVVTTHGPVTATITGGASSVGNWTMY